MSSVNDLNSRRIPSREVVSIRRERERERFNQKEKKNSAWYVVQCSSREDLILRKSTVNRL